MSSLFVIKTQPVIMCCLNIDFFLLDMRLLLLAAAAVVDRCTSLQRYNLGWKIFYIQMKLSSSYFYIVASYGNIY